MKHYFLTKKLSAIWYFQEEILFLEAALLVSHKFQDFSWVDPTIH